MLNYMEVNQIKHTKGFRDWVRHIDANVLKALCETAVPDCACQVRCAGTRFDVAKRLETYLRETPDVNLDGLKIQVRIAIAMLNGTCLFCAATEIANENERELKSKRL